MVVDVAVVPVAVVVQPRAHREARAERNRCCRNHSARRRTRALLDVDDLRVVGRDVDHLRLRRHDRDVASVDDDLLLRVRHERSRGTRACAKPLDRRHHVGRLFDVRLADGRGPVEIVRHLVDDRRVVCDGLYRDVPVLAVDLVLVVAGAQPPRGAVDLVDKRRRRKHLRKQRIRIERNWRKQIVELVGVKERRGRGRKRPSRSGPGQCCTHECGNNESNTSSSHGSSPLGSGSTSPRESIREPQINANKRQSARIRVHLRLPSGFRPQSSSCRTPPC